MLAGSLLRNNLQLPVRCVRLRLLHSHSRTIVSGRVGDLRCYTSISNCGKVTFTGIGGCQKLNSLVNQQIRSLSQSMGVNESLEERRQRLASTKYLTFESRAKKRMKDGIRISVSIILLMVGISMASVPLYKVFCSATGYGGTTKKHNEEDNARVRDMQPVEWRPITVQFSGTVNPGLDWSFVPVQKSVSIVPGETCLAFFTAKNNSSRVITGISTYNVTPFEAGAYFNKIQCFCFDEQTLNPGEELDMPVFFYIDPEFVYDSTLINLNCADVALHYTFFDTEEPKKMFVEFARDVKAYLKGDRTEPPPFDIPEGENIVKVNDGVYKEIIRKGYDKDFIYPGCTAVVHVTGTIADTGKIFWSTRGGTPFQYTAGTGSVIDGWDDGCMGMSEGEITKIHLASTKAYGKLGNRSWDIPRHTNIDFEIEVMAIR